MIGYFIENCVCLVSLKILTGHICTAQQESCLMIFVNLKEKGQSVHHDESVTRADNRLAFVQALAPPGT